MMGDQEAPQGVQQARSMQIPKRWPLVNTLDSRDGEFLKDARLVNAYAEKSPMSKDYHVIKRPGFALTTVIDGSGPGQGIVTYPYVQTTGSNPFLGINAVTLYVTGGIAFSLVTDSQGGLHGPVNLGAVAFNSGTKFQFLGIPGGVNSLIIFGGDNRTAVGSNSCYVYRNGALTHLTAGDGTNFPSNTVPGFAYLDGFVYVMDNSGTIWETTNQNVVTGAGSWDATGFITAASDADIAVQLSRQLIYIVAIKTWTTQFYYDAGNTTGSSLSPVPGALYNFGCIDSDTFQNLDGTLLWATQSKEGTFRIVLIENLNDRFVSTPAVEKQLALGPGSTWYSQAYQLAGHRFYVITNLTTNVTMVFDIGENLWYLWTDYQGNYFPVVDRCAAPDGGEWQQIGSNGNVYQVNADYVYPNDSGNIVPVDIYTPNFDAGVDRIKTLSQMRFNADQTPGSKLFVRFSDNDYQSWNNFRQIDLSRTRPILNDEGSFYRRAYHFRHYANTKLRIRSVDLQMDIGTL